MKSVYRILLACSSIAMSAAAMAHHSTAAYDVEHDTVIEGVVEDYHWANPHCWIRVLVKDAAGATKTWNIEAGAPSVSVRSGWTPSTLKPGDRATFVFKARKDGEPSGALAVMILPDGTRLPGVVAPSGPLPNSPAASPAGK